MNLYVINDKGLTIEDDVNYDYLVKVEPMSIPKVFFGMYVSPYEDGHSSHFINIYGGYNQSPTYKATNYYPECSKLPKVIFAKALKATRSYASWLKCSVSWIEIN